MKTTLSYVLTALLAFAAAFFYFKTKEPVKTPDTTKTDIETYAIAEFFKQEAKMRMDSVSNDALEVNPKNPKSDAKKVLRENLQDYLYWDDETAKLINEAAERRKKNCPSGFCPPTMFLMDGCIPCYCCRLFDPRWKGYPPDYQLAGSKTLNARFYFEGKEITLSSIENSGFLVYTVPQNTRIDKISVTRDGKEVQMSVPQAAK
jgi:hypothetical protein